MLNSCSSGVTVVNIDNGFWRGIRSQPDQRTGFDRPEVTRLKTLYLDIFSGISGDMFMGAMLDLGVELRQVEQELAKIFPGRLSFAHLPGQTPRDRGRAIRGAYRPRTPPRTFARTFARARHAHEHPMASISPISL